MNNEFRSPKTLSYLAIGGLAATALLDVFSTIVGFIQLASPESALDLDDGPMSVWLLIQGLIALLTFPVAIFTVVFFLIWLNRTNKNLHPLGAQNVEFSSGWAVGWWFIPFANLVKPFQVVREVWFDSDPETSDEPTFLSASLKSAPTFMGLWWGFWIGSNILENISSRLYNPDSMQDIEIMGLVFVISGIVGVIAALLAIKVVKSITDRQEARALTSVRHFDYSPPPPPQF